MAKSLAERESNRCKHQTWRVYPASDNDNVINGSRLAQRLWQLGVILHVEDLLNRQVGECIKTGVSAYERLT